MKDKIKISRNHFTLIELMAAMGVFAIIMLIMLTFFNSAQKAWTNCINRGQIYENARIAMDLITRDLQCTYYEVDRVPFWNKGLTQYSGGTPDAAIYNRQMLAFTSATMVLPNANCIYSKICKIKYQLYNCKTSTPSSFGDSTKEGWLMRSATGDYDNTTVPGNPNTKWPSYYISTLPWGFGIVGKSGSVYSADQTSSDDYNKVVPYMTNLEFTCYNRDGSEIVCDNEGDGSSGANSYKMTFPYSVRIELSLMDQQSWLKWKIRGGGIYSSGGAIVEEPIGATTQAVAVRDFRANSERTFSKLVILGNRDQYSD